MQNRQNSIQNLSLPGIQKGVVLIIGLLILLSMTIIGVSAMNTSSLEERMAGNFRDRNIAFQAAEAALRDGERYIEANRTAGITDPTNFNTTCDASPGHCLSNGKTATTTEYWTVPANWSTSTKHRTYAVAFAEVASPAKYIIEHMGNTCPAANPSCGTPAATDPFIFRVTALGYGQSIKTSVMLQSTYKLE